MRIDVSQSNREELAQNRYHDRLFHSRSTCAARSPPVRLKILYKAQNFSLVLWHFLSEVPSDIAQVCTSCFWSQSESLAALSKNFLAIFAKPNFGSARKIIFKFEFRKNQSGFHFDLLVKFRCDLQIRFSNEIFRFFQDDRHAAIAGFPGLNVDRDCSQERNFEPCCFSFASP